MLSENRNSSLSFRAKIQKKMLLLKNKELFGIHSINILMKINLSIDIASEFVCPIKKLCEIGIICDSNIIAYQKNRLASTFYMSSILIDKNLQNESRFPIKPFSDEELSDEFLFLINSTNDKVSNWSYFYIPFSIDSYHIQCLIGKNKCGIKSILKNIQDEIYNVSKMKSQLNIKQPFMENPNKSILNQIKNSEKIEFSENVFGNRIFFKELRHKLPNKIEEKPPSNPPSNEPKKIIFRLNFGGFTDDLVANLNQTEPTLENIITDDSKTWKPFVL